MLLDGSQRATTQTMGRRYNEFVILLAATRLRRQRTHTPRIQ